MLPKWVAYKLAQREATTSKQSHTQIARWFDSIEKERLGHLHSTVDDHGHSYPTQGAPV